MDDTLYEESFDVIIVGTGTQEAMIAGALGLAGKKVLHVDANEYYGDMDASFNLMQLIEWADARSVERAKNITEVSSKQSDEDVIGLPDECTFLECAGNESVHRVTRSSCSMEELYDFLKRRSNRAARCAARCAASTAHEVSIRSMRHVEEAKAKVLSDAKSSEGKDEEERSTGEKKALPTDSNDSPTIQGKTKEIAENMDDFDVPNAVRFAAGLWEKSRGFIVDLSPRVILCNGEVVNALVRAGVHRYMEYMTLQQMSVFDTSAISSSSSSSSKTMPTFKLVPSSKRDVFKCRWLGLLEKRALMNFLQFCNDFAFASVTGPKSGKTNDVMYQNETMLNQQRSLARPQNKKAATRRGKSRYDYESFRKRPFAEFLKAGGMPLSLRQICMYAIAMANDEVESALTTHASADASAMTTEVAMRRLCAYVASLGRHGTTAFLCPMYGAGEIPQSFCRLCAVNRGVYLLRERMCGIAVESSKSSGGRCRGIFFASKRKFLPCAEHVIMGAHLLPDAYRRVEGPPVVRMIAICSDYILRKDDGEGDPAECARTLCVVLPLADEETHAGRRVAVRCLQVDDSVRACPSDLVVLHLWAQSLSKDKASVCDAAEQVRRAFERLLADARSRGTGEGSSIAEKEQDGVSDHKTIDVLYRLEYMHRTFTSVASEDTRALPTNLHVCNSSECAASAHYQETYREAKKIFSKICPSKKHADEHGGFLVIPKERPAMRRGDGLDEWGELDLDSVMGDD
eukprot:g2236.t1